MLCLSVCPSVLTYVRELTKNDTDLFAVGKSTELFYVFLRHFFSIGKKMRLLQIVLYNTEEELV